MAFCVATFRNQAWAPRLLLPMLESRLKDTSLLQKRRISSRNEVIGPKHRIYQQMSKILHGKLESHCRVEGLSHIKNSLEAGWRPAFVACHPRSGQQVQHLLSSFRCDASIWLCEKLEKVMFQPRLEPRVIAQGPYQSLTAPTHWKNAVVIACQDPYNVGAIIRTSLAYGVDAVCLWEGSANPFGYHAIKASASTVFMARFLPQQAMVSSMLSSRRSVNAWSAEAHSEHATLHTDAPLSSSERTVLVFGHETKGVPRQLQRMCQPLTIALPNDNVESLSVNAAAAILLDRLFVN